MTQTVKNPPAMWESWVWSLVGKIPKRKAWQPTPVFLPGESPWTEEPARLQSTGSQRVGHDWSDWACVQQEKPSLTLGPQGLALLVNKQVNSQIEVNKHAPGYVILPTINVSRGTQAKTSPKEEAIFLGFSLLEEFLLQFWFLFFWWVCWDFLFLPGSVWKVILFKEFVHFF